MDARRDDERSTAADEALLRAAMEGLPFGVAVLSLPDLVFEYVNPLFQASAAGIGMAGRPSAEVFPEMSYLAPEVLGHLAEPGDTWREAEAVSRIRRTPGGPVETVHGSYTITLLEMGDRRHLLVTGSETTEERLVLENKRLEGEERRRLELAETLDGINRVIHSSLDYDEIMQRALEEGTRAVEAQAGAVFVGLNNESEARYVFGFPKAFLGQTFSADIFPFSKLLEHTKDPVPVTAAEMGSLMNPTLAKLFRVRSLLAIPIVIRGRLTGGIGLVYRHPHDFVPAEISFARAFGATLSLALENAELFRRQERVADTLQEALLQLPEYVPGLSFAHAYRSASEAVKVGGDFYDLFELEHDTVGLTLGDISGKGLDAAVLTSLVKNAIRAQATELRNTPAEVLHVVNTVLFRASRTNEFATVFFGLLDCADGGLVYSNGGHTATGVIRADGTVERLPANSQLVGALRKARFADARTVLLPGDQLFMYTDGLIEARRGKEFFGEDRVFTLLAKYAASAPQQLVESMVDEVVAFTGGRLTDDLAMLSVKRL